MAEVITEAQAPSWSQWITDFDKSWKLFNDNYTGLVSVGPYVREKHPELLPQYNKLVEDAQAHYQTLLKLKGVRDQVASWLTQAGHIIGGIGDTLAAPFKWIGSLFGGGSGVSGNGLGIAPIIVAVGIASASAALIVIAKWITDAFTFANKLNAMMKLESEGHSPESAAAAIQGLQGSFLGIPWKWIVIGGVLIVLGPPLIKMIEGRR